MHADEGTDTAITSLQLLHHKAVFHVRSPGATIGFKTRAIETQIGHWFNQLARKAAGTVTLLDDRDQIVFNGFASSIADQTLFIRKLGVEFEEINSPEPDSHELPASVSRRE